MKTLQECKDEVARTIYGHPDWATFRADGMDHRVYEDAHDEAAELLARSVSDYSRSKWISIKEKRPAQGVRVLGWHKYRLTTLIVTKYNESRRGGGPYIWQYYEVDGSNRLEQNDISHWQPLPKSPDNA